MTSRAHDCCVTLASLSQPEERMKVADAMVTKSYEDGDVILRQGDPADYFYIVIEGQVVIRRRGDDPVSIACLLLFVLGSYVVLGEIVWKPGCLMQKYERRDSTI